MDFESKQMSIAKIQELVHDHPLIPFTRFYSGSCMLCQADEDYIYEGYRCNELGCVKNVYHKECANPPPEINHSSHPEHSLKLIIIEEDLEKSLCKLCGINIRIGYWCPICDFKVDLRCARSTNPLAPPEYSSGHKHPLVYELVCGTQGKRCKACHTRIQFQYYRCQSCEFVIHLKCLDFQEESYHTSHPQHKLKSLEGEIPDYADEKCLLCEKHFDQKRYKLQHCDVCNFSICKMCRKDPPPVNVQSLTTHEHQLHLVPRRVDFTCNACGELGDRSPYFCLQCNFMIHRQCIDLPRVININRHDHRISYTRRLGHGEWKCRVCRKKVNGFYGAYTCVKCPNFVAHSLCATRDNVWDKRELEGIPEEEETPPFEVIDDKTIKHFSHEHNLQINKDSHGEILPENIVCEACVLQILSEPFYSCKQCNFVLHEKCANHPRKKRHMSYSLPYTLHTDTRHEVNHCWICQQYFTGFRYKSFYYTMDVRCAAISDILEHESHQHPLYCVSDKRGHVYECDDCDYILDKKYIYLPRKVLKTRYDDHPLLLYFGDKDVDGDYWCEVCETKVNPKEWFYTCYGCNTILHISCVVGDFSYIMPGSVDKFSYGTLTRFKNQEVVSNTSICRPLCSGCNCRCKLPTIIKLCKDGVDVYFCSLKCRNTSEGTWEDETWMMMMARGFTAIELLKPKKES